ncbi:MAG: hypothetical protein U0229_25765 [Anaeromyxobacter sp.]
MAEAPKTASVPSSTSGKRTGSGFELRLERGTAHVRLARVPVVDGLELEVLDLLVPDVRFPFDVGAGSGQFRHRLSDLDELGVAAAPELAERTVAAAGPEALGLLDLRIAFREGFAEIAGRLAGGTRFTLRAGLVPSGDRGVAVVLHAPRLYGPAALPEGALVHAGRRLLAALGEDALPEDPVSRLLRRVLAPRGWKIPRAVDVRLARAEIVAGAARLGWSRAAVPAAVSADPDLLAAEEGARTFATAEALLERGDHEAAREAYLATPAASGHPFAAERLLGLLALDDRFHDEALDLAQAWLARRPGFPAALGAEAAVRIARGEDARAARALADLAEGAAARGEVFSALAAAETAFGLAGADAIDARRAAEVALQVRRDHVPALRALRDLALAAGDREALVRASRRLVAYDADPAHKARAHAQLGELLLGTDPAAARLHLDQALRHAPDEPQTLRSLARACEAAGEHLRAVRALDRLRELHLARGDRALAAGAAYEAGALWDGPLGHAENALLRFREAAELAPSAEAHERAAAAATRAGQWAEAADHHAAVLTALARGAPGPAGLAARTRVALAAIAEERLADLPAAAAHLEAAAALEPDRADLWRRLAALDRTLGRTAALAAAQERVAALSPDPAERAAALAEAGEAALALGLPAEARGRFVAALAADERNRTALDGLAQLAASRGDAAAERDALARLLPLAGSAEEAATLQDRLAEACEKVGDLAGAHRALAAARAAAPTPARLEASLRHARRTGDVPAQAALLAERAASAAARGDAPLATSSWLERARLLGPTDPAQAQAALAEARAAAPGDPEVLRAQAAFGEANREPRLALGALRALLAQDPADAPELEVRAGRAALAAGEPTAAREHAERALGRDAPGSGDLLADILDRTGDEAGRAELLDRIGRPLEAARLHERRGDRPRAIAALERAALDPASAAEALERLADLRLQEGDRRGAATALLALAARTPGRAGARLALRAFESGGDASQALDLAAERDPAYAPARSRRAALRADADPRGALADAEAALAGDELAPAERTGLVAIAARAAEALGDDDRAGAHLAALARATPEDASVLRRLAALERRAGRAEALADTLARLVPFATPAEGVALRLELSELLAGSDPGRAAALAEEALALDPDSTRALAALAWPPRSAGSSPAVRADRLGRLAARPDLPRRRPPAPTASARASSPSSATPRARSRPSAPRPRRAPSTTSGPTRCAPSSPAAPATAPRRRAPCSPSRTPPTGAASPPRASASPRPASSPARPASTAPRTRSAPRARPASRRRPPARCSRRSSSSPAPAATAPPSARPSPRSCPTCPPAPAPTRSSGWPASRSTPATPPSPGPPPTRRARSRHAIRSPSSARAPPPPRRTTGPRSPSASTSSPPSSRTPPARASSSAPASSPASAARRTPTAPSGPPWPRSRRSARSPTSRSGTAAPPASPIRARRSRPSPAARAISASPPARSAPPRPSRSRPATGTPRSAAPAAPRPAPRTNPGSRARSSPASSTCAAPPPRRSSSTAASWRRPGPRSPPRTGSRSSRRRPISPRTSATASSPPPR